MNGCKFCENCDLASNTCIKSGQVCYDKGVCKHPDCDEFEKGKWEEM